METENEMNCSCARLLVQAVCLTGSDLSSSTKPWSVQETTSAVVYQEFYEQVKQKWQLYQSTLKVVGRQKNAFVGSRNLV